MINSLENIYKYLSDNRTLLNNYEFHKLYEDSSSKLEDEEIGLMTNVLLKSGVNPLIHLNYVPRTFLYSQADVTDIDIPNNITFIDLYAFADCKNLKSIIIPNSVESIGDGVFKNCWSLTKISIPDSVTSIGSEVFGNCSSLTDIGLSNSLAVIGDFAFSGCSGLKSLRLPNNVSVIGDNAFEDCEELINIVINSNVEKIGYSVFGRCNKLLKIDYSGTKEQWQQIDIAPGWFIRSKIKEIKCIDGTIALK